MEIQTIMKERYSAKDFDQNKKISTENLEIIKQLLQTGISSVNIQPWHFIIAETNLGKKRVAKSAHGDFEENKNKILDASVVVVFASKLEVSEEYIMHVIKKEEYDGRFSLDEYKQEEIAGKKLVANLHKEQLKDVLHWTEKQVHINLGSFVLGVAALGIDAIVMEGVDMKVLNDEFGLIEKGYSATMIVSLGYHSEEDFNAALPKSRLPIDELIELV